MTVRDNGKVVRTLPVSLGAAHTPTHTGVKVVMQKGEQADGTFGPAPGRHGADARTRVRRWARLRRPGAVVGAHHRRRRVRARREVELPASGTYSTSNGCTNLTTSDAKWFYGFARLGDVVTFGATGGTTMPTDDGLGDWNVPWPVWQRGGTLPAA